MREILEMFMRISIAHEVGTTLWPYLSQKNGVLILESNEDLVETKWDE